MKHTRFQAQQLPSGCESQSIYISLFPISSNFIDKDKTNHIPKADPFDSPFVLPGILFGTEFHIECVLYTFIVQIVFKNIKFLDCNHWMLSNLKY
jgi:hypothetical protein